MSKYFKVIGIALFVLISCEKEKNGVESKTDELQITMGSICGWCTGSDSLLITEERTYYEYNTSCTGNITKKNSLTSKQDWEELIDLLDIEEFRKIDINTCYVCADGCDTWITVIEGSVSHMIRFGYNDSIEIQSVQPFIDKLYNIRSKMDNRNQK